MSEQEVLDLFYSMMHDFRYEFEGSRDNDSIESWVEEWCKKHVAEKFNQ